MSKVFPLRIFLIFLISFISISQALADELIVEPDAGRAPILSAIKDAKSNVNVVMYGWTDKSITNALINAKNSGKNVQVLLEANPYKAANENAKTISELKSHQIDVHFPNLKYKLTHQKTFLFDNQKAMVMTFNLTHSSFNKERNFALVITDPEEITEIQKVYSADWNNKPVTVQNASLFWSPDNSRAKIVNLIANAKKVIKIYAQEVNDFQMVGQLAKAARSGVHVELLLSQPSRKNLGKLNYLRRAGVFIRSSHDYRIHAKAILIDNKLALLGSINLTTPSLDQNRELSVLTKDSKVLSKLNETFIKDWDNADALVNSNHHWHISRITLQQIKHLWTLA